MRTFLLLLLVGAYIFFSCSACSSAKDDEEQSLKVQEVLSQEEDEQAVDEETRTAFGLPLPPQVLHINRSDYSIVATTDMSMDDLETFFSTRLTDYEVLRVSNRLEIRSLRPYMVSVRARHTSGHRSAISVEYRRPADRAMARNQDRTQDPLVEMDLEMESERLRDSRSSLSPDRPVWLDALEGQPVELLTDTGELLAPGARWGEPYTPPAGTPLHTPRNRANFGRPFGEWRTF